MSNPFAQFSQPSGSDNPFTALKARPGAQPSQERRDEMAARYASGSGPKAGEGKTPFHKAVGSQMKHAAEKMIYGGVLPLINSTGKVGGALTPFGGDEPAYPEHQRTIDEGAAYVNKLRGEGIPDIGGFLVEAAPQVAAAIGTGGASLVPRALAQAGAAAAVTPGSMGDRAIAGGAAAAGEGVGSLLAKGLRRMVKPINPTAEAQLLIDNKIYPTWGGAAGPKYKAFEDKLMSVPGLGDFTSFGRRGGINEYNAWVMSQSGVPIARNEIGSEGHKKIGDYFRANYPKVTKDLLFDPNDPALKQQFNDIVRNNLLTRDGLGSFNDTVNLMRGNYDLPNWEITGARAPKPAPGAITNPGMPDVAQAPTPTLMDGLGIQDFSNLLRMQSKDFRGPTATSMERRTGVALDQARNSLFEAVERQGLGGDVQPLKDLNKQYAKYQVAARASDSAGAANRDGVFTPAEGLKQFRQQAREAGAGTAFREGRLPGQDVHRAAFSVLGNNYPDSGTAGRLGVTSLLLGGGGATIPYAGPLIPATVASVLANTPYGRRYGVGELFKWQNPTADFLRNAEPYTGTTGAVLGANAVSDRYKPWEQ